VNTLASLYQPVEAVIADIIPETRDTTTYHFVFRDSQGEEFVFEPGQFNMLTVFGIGEAAISISSDPYRGDGFTHTIRHVGSVTKAVTRLEKGSVVGIRGPYGTGWPVDLLQGCNILVVAGGIGLAPLRPVLYLLGRERKAVGRVELLYGARTPRDLLFAAEYDHWRDKGIKVLLTVDEVPEGTIWEHSQGVVTGLFDRMKSTPENTIVLTCGPEIMMKFVAQGLAERGFSPEQIYVSLERRMECGVGKCGRCQIGPKFVCKDGPVFAYAELLSLPEEVL